MQLHVKRDGTGDFTGIQEAIQSVMDTAGERPCTVFVHDDFRITDLRLLWHVSTLEKVEDPASVMDQVAAIILSHGIHLIGVGSPRTVEIISPKDLPASVYQFIQVVYPMGNCILENFRFLITGGRYAIHQESGGLKTHKDYRATTVYRDIYAEHKGNEGYPAGAWESTYAQANGTTSGTRMFHRNCVWKANHHAPYYTHSNMAFDEKNLLVFEHCKMHLYGLNEVRWSDLGSGHRSEVVVRNSDIGYFSVHNRIRGLEREITNADDWRNGGAEVTGGGNAIMPAFEERPATLFFEAARAGETIRVAGGDAAPKIIGGDLMVWEATPDRPGAFWGNKRIQQVPDGLGKTRVFTLSHRLGNCANRPKTLVLEVGGETVTLTFHRNYVTADGENGRWDAEPVVSTEEILDDMNRMAAGRFTCRLDKLMRIYSFRDCMVSVQNRTATTFDPGQGLVRDWGSGWACYRPSEPGERPDAIAAGRIPVHNRANPAGFEAIDFRKAIFRGAWLGLNQLRGGSLIKAAHQGTFMITTDRAEAVMVALDDEHVQALPV